MSQLEEQINSILSDPDQMGKIASMAQSLMGGGGLMSAPEPEPENLLQKLMGNLGGEENEKTAMLRALCPCLSQRRSRKLERAIRMAQMAQLARKFMAEQGGDDYGSE